MWLPAGRAQSPASVPSAPCGPQACKLCGRTRSGVSNAVPVGGHIPDALGKSEWLMEEPASKLPSWLMAPHWASLASPLRAAMGPPSTSTSTSTRAPPQPEHRDGAAEEHRAPKPTQYRTVCQEVHVGLSSVTGSTAPRPGPLRKGATLHSAPPGPGLGQEADWESHWPHVTHDPGPAWPHTLGKTQGGQSRGARRHVDATRPPGLPSLLPAPTESLTSLMDTF